MTDAIRLIARYQTSIFVVLGVVALIYLRQLVAARLYLSRTPFGLEREVALRRQNGALAMLTVLVLLAVSVLLAGQLLLPSLLAPAATPPARPQPTPTTTPIAASGEVIVDSSGCENPNATLTAPRPNERIAGSFTVRGTANIENFAFYKFEINGIGTGGTWLSLGVGKQPRVDGDLGSFDTSAREAGNYAFRLVVLDSAGNFPPPCVVPITIVEVQLP